MRTGSFWEMCLGRGHQWHCQAQRSPVHTGRVNRHTNLRANPLMLLASCVNTPIDHNVDGRVSAPLFFSWTPFSKKLRQVLCVDLTSVCVHYLRTPVVRCSEFCVNWAL